MRIFVLFVFVIAMSAGSFASANGKNNKAHMKLTAKDGAKINCVYCHTTAGFQKKKGQDLSGIDSNKFCTGKGCHPVEKK